MGARSSKIIAQNNRSDGHLLEYFRSTFVRGGGGTNTDVVVQGLTATGGVISDYTDGPAVYRAHIFTSSGTFDVSALGDFGSNVEYLVVAGGGGGGDSNSTGHGGNGGGGPSNGFDGVNTRAIQNTGAGGGATNSDGSPPISYGGNGGSGIVLIAYPS